ncbi:MAG TPA: LEA type 2 family protein [Puia sp.]|nr:LEA type 2 family protein [Puia sp.]
MLHPKKSFSATTVLALLVLIVWATGCRQPEAPEYYSFQNPHIVRSGALTTLSTTLKFYNPNPYNLKLLRAEMDVSLNGKHAGHSLLDTTIFIPKKDTFFVPVSLEVNLNSLLNNALAVLLEKQATISLDGRVKIKRGAFTFNRPFHYDGKQDLNTLLQGTGF